MGKRKKNRLPVLTMVLFVAAAGLLMFSTIGGARAALTYYSENYTSALEMFHIGVTLNENGNVVSVRDYDANGNWEEKGGSLLERELEEGDVIIPGKKYEEALSVSNSGDIDEYVRVTIYKYWLNADGSKLQELSPAMIQLNLLCDATGVDNGWLLDEKLTNSEYAPGEREFPGERTVLYYNTPLAVEEISAPFSDMISIDGSIASYVTQEKVTENGYTTITTTYKYDGVSFRIEVEADAVQTHNAEDAVMSAWGREVSVSEDGILSLR
ncbi:MAG: hypothetical protein HFI38_08165 [Lachnospiraceae bacterium]|jgi:hypothetical protein|nr:hypothetical protein [Lachnospiraceae bacterium]